MSVSSARSTGDLHLWSGISGSVHPSRCKYSNIPTKSKRTSQTPPCPPRVLPYPLHHKRTGPIAARLVSVSPAAPQRRSASLTFGSRATTSTTPDSKVVLFEESVAAQSRAGVRPHSSDLKVCFLNRSKPRRPTAGGKTRRLQYWKRTRKYRCSDEGL